MSTTKRTDLNPMDLQGKDPQLDIPWPLVKGRQAVFIERIALTRSEAEVLGSHTARELYLFGARVKTGEVHPQYGELERIEFLVIEKPENGTEAVAHALAQHQSVMYSREDEGRDYACVDMLKKKDIRFLRRPPKWKASDASIPCHDGQLYHFLKQVYLPETSTTRQHLTFSESLFLFVRITEHDELQVQIFTQDTSQQTAEDHYRLEAQMMRFDQHHDDAQVVSSMIENGSKLLQAYILEHPKVERQALKMLAEHGKTKSIRHAAIKKGRATTGR
ncbi:hypothetical protein [Pseudomonas sp.]|uniref:hypothetical protein n=1 Tax=Pseudomonas sp. TaxID=306 RepID=UPI0028AA4312|nr:hypothetical protein [Pseudomonas sp.]